MPLRACMEVMAFHMDAHENKANIVASRFVYMYVCMSEF
jgi:hypothetical protein